MKYLTRERAVALMMVFSLSTVLLQSMIERNDLAEQLKLSQETIVQMEKSKIQAEIELGNKLVEADKEKAEVEGLLASMKEKNLALEKELAARPKFVLEYKPAGGTPMIVASEVGKAPVSRSALTRQININWKDLTVPSNANGAILDAMLKDTNLKGLGDAFASAELVYGINSIFLISLAMHESGHGTSKLAKNKNNLFGYQAYDRDPYNSAKKFSEVEEGIFTVAGALKANYLTKGGKYFKGYGIVDINHYYASDKNWNNAIKATGNKLIEKVTR